MNTRVTVQTLRAMTSRSERITMVTAYDATFARMLDQGGADVLLVGDSLGMVVQGQETTLPVTMDEMLYHCRAVARGSKRAHLVGDMPFMSYQVSAEEALKNAGRFLAEGGMHAVKLEGGADVARSVRRIVAAGIPVMGHVGLTPQSVHALGGFKVQGRREEDAERVLADAKIVAEAGAYAVVLEGIPSELASRITAELAVPTIGIGAGPHCDGQVLVCYDMLGLTAEHVPRFVKQYETFYAAGLDAMARFRQEVRAGAFPSSEHSFGAIPERSTPGVPAQLGDVEPAGPARLEASGSGRKSEPVQG
jgi:3-methyl-2-oxobutanoate hydroxymethyltransferase